jgi:hypothetical protein
MGFVPRPGHVVRRPVVFDGQSHAAFSFAAACSPHPAVCHPYLSF